MSAPERLPEHTPIARPTVTRYTLLAGTVAALREYAAGFVGSQLATDTLARVDEAGEAPPGDVAVTALRRIVAGEHCNDDEVRSACADGSGDSWVCVECDSREIAAYALAQLGTPCDRLDLAVRALSAILTGEPATDGDYDDDAEYPLLPYGEQLDDGQVAAAAALERVRRVGTQQTTSPQATDTTATTRDGRAAPGCGNR